MSQTSEITVINSEKKYQRHRRVELVQKRDHPPANAMAGKEPESVPKEQQTVPG